MESNTGIYVFENTKEHKAYIGQSSNLKRRINYHYFFNLKEHQNEFHQTLKEHPEYFIKSVVEYCTEEELADKEIYWMNRYESEGWDLYNEIRTKQVVKHRNSTYSEETRRKLSEAHKGKHHSEESKKKLSEKRKGENNPMYGRSGELSPRFGIKHTEETKQKLREKNLGKKLSEETRRKISEHNAWKGNHLSEEHRRKISEATKGKKETKKVGCYKDGKLIKVYDAMIDTEKDGYFRSNVWLCCNGKYKSAYGYQWKYIE